VGHLVLATLRAVASGVRYAVSVEDDGVQNALTPVCRSLVSFGVLAVDEGKGGPVRLGAPAAVRLVRAAAHAGISVPPAPSSVFQDRATVVDVLVKAILAAHAGVSASTARGKSQTRTVETPVPTEACYDANLATVLRRWFGVVDVQVPAGGGFVDLMFRATESASWTLVELVCHKAPDGVAAPTRKQSVGVHVLRTVTYLEAYPGSGAALINFDVEG
jgi:hypothetical protein